MKKVLIVDDEMIIRVGMKSIIDWQQYGYELVGEAGDGREAMESIREYWPDIVITDIKMPVMDGLRLIEEAQKLNKVPKFVVLSNYNEFDIVKEAMKLGAQDYMLKYRMSPEQLLAILGNVRSKIEESSKNENMKMQIEHQIQKNLPIMRRQFFSDLINNDSVNEDEFYMAKDFLKIAVELESICCIAVKIQNLQDLESMGKNDLAMVNTSIINITEEIIGDNFNGYCIDMGIGEFCAVLSAKPEFAGSSLVKEKLIETRNRLNEMLYKYLNLRFSIVLGPVERGVGGLRESYGKAREIMKSGVVNDYNHIIVLKAKDFIDRNYNRDLTTQDVADFVNLSRSYFCMLFSEHMSTSCNDYITKTRLDHAKALLRNTDLKIYKISEMVGYSNCQYFSRVFKKTAGVTPLEYRMGM